MPERPAHGRARLIRLLHSAGRIRPRRGVGQQPMGPPGLQATLKSPMLLLTMPRSTL
jgi:hypothetical protein